MPLVKKAVPKINSYLFPAITIAAIVFCLTSGCLYQQNNAYRSVNRRLIIQNDSIISVNIELKNALMEKTMPAKKNRSVAIKD